MNTNRLSVIVGQLEIDFPFNSESLNEGHLTTMDKEKTHFILSSFPMLANTSTSKPTRCHGSAKEIPTVEEAKPEND